ncbi:MAG TPA: acyloxyacyl hydrolase [Sphingomicrobium sp.]|nr:acyloxyacyl hydrolase [Sphingomicrobium sp.]
MTRILLLLAATCLAPSPASAGELFGGVYIHDIDSPLTKSGIEKGADVLLGYRWGRIGKTPLQPYLFGAVNTAGETHYAVAGLSAKLGKRFYIRPGVGIALHSGDNQDFEDPGDDDVEFGTSVLFAPEVGIGFTISDRASVEASLVHLSHAQLFGGQNPGIDNVGLRFNWKF